MPLAARLRAIERELDTRQERMLEDQAIELDQLGNHPGQEGRASLRPLSAKALRPALHLT